MNVHTHTYPKKKICDKMSNTDTYTHHSHTHDKNEGKKTGESN